jgi:tetratricopeptide (TPR) repeat protein
MELTPQDRLVPEVKPESRLFRFVVLAIAALGVMAAFALIPQGRETARGIVLAARNATGFAPPDTYGPVYQRLGMAPLSARLRGLPPISSGLERLVREPCDKRAIFTFGEALLAAHEDRAAADAYVGFAAGCPNGDGEQYRAAEIFMQLGDNPKAIALADVLVDRNPAIGAYHYLRGKALAGAKRYAEAIDDYKRTIELQKDPRALGEWVFVEMANLYAAMGRPCDAAKAMLAWIAIDASARDTPDARKKAEAYAAQGCAPEPPPVTQPL